MEDYKLALQIKLEKLKYQIIQKEMDEFNKTMPTQLQQRIKDWLEVNNITKERVRYGYFPLGMVNTWIERAELAELKLKQLGDLILTQQHQKSGH